MKQWLGVIGLVVAVFGLAIHVATAQVAFTVNSTLDEIDSDTADGLCRTAAGTCTLRAAVMQANLISGSGAVIHLPAGIYALTRPAIGDNGPDSGGLNLTTPETGNPTITISGDGSAASIIDANGLDTVIHVAAGRVADLTGVTIQGGYGDYGGGIRNDGVLNVEGSRITDNETSLDDGGGILNHGSLTVKLSTITGNHSNGTGGGVANLGTASISFSGITDNSANRGGGIYNAGSLEVTSTPVDTNVASLEGGGIYNVGTASLTFSPIAVNTSELEGGGIYNHALGALFLSADTVLGNHSGYVGGGLFNQGTTRIKESTINHNEANHGGGIANDGPLVLGNSTVSENEALLAGGGIYNRSSLEIYSSTLVLNEADADASSTGEAGGIYSDAAGYVYLRNTLLAYNFAADGAILDECHGILTVFGNNLIGQTGTVPESCLIDWTNGYWEYTDSDVDSLGPLADNGGPTWTHALLAGHDAIDAGDPAGGCVDQNAVPLLTDQRGGPRVVGPACDIGAYEFGAISPPTPTPPPAEFRLYLPAIGYRR